MFNFLTDASKKQVLALTLLLLVAALQASAQAPRCQDVVTGATSEFWSRETPQILGYNHKNQAQIATFSFDSEIELDELWGLIRTQSPQIQAQAKADMDKVFGEFTLEYLLQNLNMSEAQFNTFALRRNTPKSSAYSITDLNASAMRKIWMIAPTYQVAKGLVPIATKYVLPILHAKGIPVALHLDGFNIEFTHESFAKNPKEFSDQIRKLHALLPNAQTHFHIGLPIGSVSKKAFDEIGRATEAKIVLGLLQNATAYANGSLAWVGTQFSGETVFGGLRGVVKLQESRFPEGSYGGENRWHDFEVRQWKNINDGLATVRMVYGLAYRFANDPKSIHSSADREYPKEVDRRYGNIDASLQYVAETLNRHPQYQSVAAALEKYVRTSGNTDAEIRKLEKFLQENRVLDLYVWSLLH